MNILYDHQIFSLQDVGGISRYYTNLINGLKKEHNVKLPIKLSNNVFLKEFEKDLGLEVRGFYPGSHWKGKNNIIYWHNKYSLLWKREQLDKILQDIDIVHLTMFDPYLVDILEDKKIPFVFTIYDLNHKTQPKKYIGLCDYRNRGIEKLSTHAEKIITVSNTTKQQYLKYYPEVDPDKLKTIHHSIDLSQVNNLTKLQTNRLVDGNYILYVGDRMSEHKNFVNFVRNISNILSSDMGLICLGNEFGSSEISLFKDLNISNYIKQISGHNEIKYNLYKYATCFVYPSVAEGFGIPILEARASGCPVICTDIEIFEEVGGDAVLYVDNQTLSDLSDKILSIIGQSEIRKKMIAKGYQRVEIFDQKYEIGQTLELYKQIINNYHKK